MHEASTAAADLGGRHFAPAEQVTFRLNNRGRISVKTAIALFIETVRRTRSLQYIDMSKLRVSGSLAHETGLGFYLGCRAYERIMIDAGLDEVVASLDGSTIDIQAGDADRVESSSAAEFDPPLDPGIAVAVRVLREAGIETYESCEGGTGHAFPYPAVRFHGDKSEGFRAFDIALKNGLPVHRLNRIWCAIDGEPVGPTWELVFTGLVS